MSFLPTSVEPQQPLDPRAHQSADLRAPLLTAKLRRGVLTISCDEACRVTVRAGRRTVVRSLAGRAPLRVKLDRKVRRVTLTAADAAGNAAKRTVRAGRR